MKKWYVISWAVAATLLGTGKATAQATELAQLALNIEKLNQFRSILSDMKKGYEQLSGGYNLVKNIAEGNFKLHQVFLYGLMEVSPAVKKYRRIGAIMDDQVRIFSQSRSALRHFKDSERFTVAELNYLSSVYGRLNQSALAHLDDLLTIVTSGILRMSDDERLRAIDTIYEQMADRLAFLKVFNQRTDILRIQRKKEAIEVRVLNQFYK